MSVLARYALAREILRCAQDDTKKCASAAVILSESCCSEESRRALWRPALVARSYLIREGRSNSHLQVDQLIRRHDEIVAAEVAVADDSYRLARCRYHRGIGAGRALHIYDRVDLVAPFIDRHMA